MLLGELPLRHDEPGADVRRVHDRRGQVAGPRGRRRLGLLRRRPPVPPRRRRATSALVEATPEAYREKGRFTPPDQPDRGRSQAWAYPVVANGRLYLRDLGKLWCYDVCASKTSEKPGRPRAKVGPVRYTRLSVLPYTSPSLPPMTPAMRVPLRLHSSAGPAALLISNICQAADWPHWRYDAQRSTASPQELPAKLHLHWVRELPPLEAGLARSGQDAVRRRLRAGRRWGRRCSSARRATIRVTAYDTAQRRGTGASTPTARSASPRPAGKSRVYFASDDGYLYCLDAADGTLLWKFRGGPSDRKILGNERLISTWPARGAPVIADGTVYFAASIWPFMGIFIHALDARTGQVGLDQRRRRLALHEAAAQRRLASPASRRRARWWSIGDKLLVPGGRSVPACFDRKTGKLLHYQLGRERQARRRLARSRPSATSSSTAAPPSTWPPRSTSATSASRSRSTTDVLYAYRGGDLPGLRPEDRRGRAGRDDRPQGREDQDRQAGRSTSWPQCKIAAARRR